LRKEIEFLDALRPVESVASMLGVMYDTETGLRGGKRHRRVYPTIVMEKLEGKDLCDRVVMLMQDGHRGFTERIASTIFKNFLIALRDVHDVAGMINCDLKTENMVFVGAAEDDYRIKIIDFGTALHVDAASGASVSETVRGTTGFFAPETLRSHPGRYQYSKQSDVWQAGCILFVILHAALPFGNTQQSNANIKAQYPTSSYIPLNRNLSDEVKDLILRMLEKDVAKRITIREALEHPWITGTNARSDVDLGPEYRMRIKSWAYRKKLKQVLKDRMYVSQEQKEEICRVAMVAFMGESDSPKPHLSIANAQFKTLQREFMKITEGKDSREVCRDEFFSVATGAGFPWLANPRIFSIFDNNLNGSVDYFEFLISLIPFRTEYDPNDLARFYFEVFDLDGNGAIDEGEFEWALKMFLMDTDAAMGAPPHHSTVRTASETSAVDSVASTAGSEHDGSTTGSESSEFEFVTEHSSFEDIFKAIDANGDGVISLMEFSNFFRVVNTSRSTVH
jgi:calcium-dependent protein kinase